jgi:hypothetical protein
VRYHWIVPLALAPLCALVAACGSGAPIDGPITTLDVRGRVEDPSGLPVPEAVVSVAWRPFACGGELAPAPPDTTTATGEFDIPLFAWGTFALACVRLEVEPPAGSALQAGVRQVDSVPLAPKERADTLVVRVTLSAAQD